MIKTYLFEHIYIKFSLMKSLKTFLSLIILMNIALSQSSEDLEGENPSSDNWQENYRSLSRNESTINIYSNAAVADVFVWNSPWQSTERTFPAVISLPTDNRVYTISYILNHNFNILQMSYKILILIIEILLNLSFYKMSLSV